MYCGEEGDLHILLFRHLEAPLPVILKKKKLTLHLLLFRVNYLDFWFTCEFWN